MSISTLENHTVQPFTGNGIVSIWIDKYLDPHLNQQTSKLQEISCKKLQLCF